MTPTMNNTSKHKDPTQEQIENLQYANKYVGLGTYIQKKFHAGDVVGYRMVHNPTIGEDSLPVAVLRPKRPAVGDSPEELRSMHENMTDGEKKSAIAKYGLSHFSNPMQCALNLEKQYKKIQEINPIEAEKYKEQFGTYIVRVNYTEKDGLVENKVQKKTGHFEFLPAKEFKLSEHIDDTFGAQPYQNYLRDEQDK